MPAQSKGPLVPCTPQCCGRDTRPLSPRLSSALCLSGASPPSCPTQVEPGCRQGRPRVQLVYVNSFGSHRCGSVTRYGRGCRQAAAGQAGPSLSPSPMGEAEGLRAVPAPGDKAGPALPAARGRAKAVGSCGVAKPVSLHRGDLRENKADTFDFPFPSRNVDKVIKRKKPKSKVWHKVWKVISKMLEENEKFRSRLLTCNQFNGEGNDMNQSSQNEASYLDKEETIFGWV
ncbi:uncharacterized protein C5orf47 homolog [Antrostomus carolinensis]|uniref:uncharacterized protein C5orf47 homolog n=1 Tax=Antrostomus carolinensis TaxID=279965 RepID=UPI0010A97F52|nr:uncharacterized protein C5orf47 homolog [Antrostomus carolinensis]